MNDFNVEIITALRDNYIYMLHDVSSNDSAVVDPTIDKPIFEILKNKERKLTSIFCTHKHWDHIGGATPLKKKTSCAIYGGIRDANSIQWIDKTLDEGDTISFAGCRAEILFLPGHTQSTTAYYFKEQNKIFVGDLVFPLGCGRVFDGTMEDLFNSIQRIKKLPKNTLIYTGHEYAHGNARFALTIEPNNKKLLERFYKIAKMTKEGKPTNPTLLSDELETNPFMRTDSEEIRKNLAKEFAEEFNIEKATDLEIFAKLRKKKDEFLG